MPKYDALEDHLSSLAADEWNATFAEIERILGFGLPKAREHSSTINVLLMCC